MMNTDNRLLTRESSEHIREFFSTVERLSVSMERLSFDVRTFWCISKLMVSEFSL